MIFGFNTDVKHGETVYHVQSEANSNSQQLLTTIFVQGRCVGKKSASYAEHAAQPDCTDEKIHELLKDQHRRVLESIREGQLDTITTPSSN
jgi:succinate dehydrogenase/fumarate reductase flavoprotein subunit